MQFHADMYGQMLEWEQKRLAERPVLWRMLRPLRWPLIVLSYGGAFICSAVVLWSFPFSIIGVFTAPPSLWWWLFAGGVTAATGVFLLIVLARTIQAWGNGVRSVDGIVFGAGLLLTFVLQIAVLPMGIERFFD